jgi:hypothetical protein
MKCQETLRKLTLPLLLAGLILGKAAWASDSSGSCKIENGRYQVNNWTAKPGDIATFGDLKLRVIKHADQSIREEREHIPYGAIFDMKAPGFEQMNVKVTNGSVFSICNQQVRMNYEPGNRNDMFLIVKVLEKF